MGEQIDYMGQQWISIDDGIVTIGINEDVAADLTDDLKITLPAQDDQLSPGKVCGDIISADGTLNIYCPVEGVVVEVNENVLKEPGIIIEDPTDEGWLFKVEADDPDDIDNISLKTDGFDDDDKDDGPSLSEAGFGEVDEENE